MPVKKATVTPLALTESNITLEPKLVLPKASGKETKAQLKPVAQPKPTLKYQLVQFSKLEPNENNFRQEYGNLQPLVYEIVNEGIGAIDPIRVFPADEKGMYLIDRGHRRWKAIKIAIEKGLLVKNVSVPCMIDDTLTEERQLLGQLSSNAGKKYTPMEMYGVIEALAKNRECDEIEKMLPSVGSKLIKFYFALAQFYDEYLRSAVQLDIVSLSCAAKLAYASDVADETTGLWSQLKNRLVGEYNACLKKIPEKEVFKWLDELRNGKELPRERVITVPDDIKKGILDALDDGYIQLSVLDWLMQNAGVDKDALAGE